MIYTLGQSGAPRFGKLTKKQRERGFYGGTFDPPHLGHVDLVRTAKQLGIRHVTVIPAAGPIHKQHGLVTDYEHRLAMARLAFADEPGTDVSDIERDLAQPTPTIDTMRALFKNFDTQRYKVPFIIGADSLHGLPTWQEAKTLIRQLVFIVCGRDHLTMPDTLTVKGEAMHVRVEPLPLDTPMSSTDIRAMVKNGATRDELAKFVPERVADYIIENNLYKD